MAEPPAEKAPEPAALQEDDWSLIEEAKSLLVNRFVHGEHYVAAALRSTDGEIYTGLNIGTNIGRAEVCAEPVALGAARSEGLAGFDCVVALRHPPPHEDGEPFVVSPCGVCREMLTDYSSDAWIIVPRDGGSPGKVRAENLLPNKYIRSYRGMQTE